jgi:hypothetical protein
VVYSGLKSNKKRFSVVYNGVKVNRNGRAGMGSETFSIISKVYRELGGFRSGVIEKDEFHLGRFQGDDIERMAFRKKGNSRERMFLYRNLLRTAKESVDTAATSLSITAKFPRNVNQFKEVFKILSLSE